MAVMDDEDDAVEEDLTLTDFSQLILLTAVAVLFFLFLYYLIKMAQRKITMDYPLPKQDEFLKEYGYSWDYVFVFNVYDEDEKMGMTEIQRKLTLKNIIDRISYAEMETKCFYSVRRPTTTYYHSSLSVCVCVPVFLCLS